MPKWEYKIVDLDHGQEPEENEKGERHVDEVIGLITVPCGSNFLNRLGREGWEVVSVVQQHSEKSDKLARAYLKRRASN